MYGKLFASILDSSVWLQPPTTRLVWLTLLAAKDEDGFARFATVENLASRARVSLEDAATAVAVLEAPDRDSSNPDQEGRRIERVPGGWVVINAKLYDALAKRAQEREQVRERVRRHRERTGSPLPPETASNAMAVTEVKRTPQWLTHVCDVYERHYGAGSFPYGKAGKTLKPLHDAGHSGEEIASRFDRYCERLDDIKYLSLAKFKESFAAFADGALPTKGAKNPGAQMVANIMGPSRD